MRTMHLAIIGVLVASSIIASQNVFANTAEEILQQRDNAKKTGLAYNGTMLIVTQDIDKTEFKTGEKFSVIPHLANVGNNVASITHGEPLFELEVLDKNGHTSFIWGDTIATIGITETLEPGMSTTGLWVSRDGGFPEIALDKPGNYTIYSMASINSEGIPAHTESIWSQPLEITISPANYTSQINSTSSIPQNVIPTPNGGWVTPLQKTENGTRLTIHYEKGVDVSGKIMPPPPTENMMSPKQFQTPLQQFKAGMPLEDIRCPRPLFLFFKTSDHSPVCLTIGTTEILSHRNVIDDSDNMTLAIVHKKAEEFVLSSPTFEKFGVKSSLFVDPSGTCLLVLPEDCFIQVLFDGIHTGYGNGTNGISRTSNVIHHFVGIRINDTNNVMCAVIDGVWDEKEQKPLDKSDKQCGYLYGFKGGFP